jgi:predicted ATPase
VLSLHQVILKSREQDKVFGFDDTYFDLAKALQIPAVRGKNFAAFAQSRTKLEEMFGGTVVYDQTTRQWQFQQGRQKFPIGVTAEGIRKIAILDTLLGNRYLSPDSVVFVDEPESALHPEAIAQLLDIVELLAKSGIQFFLASHSYFVIKKLYLMAQEQGLSIPVLSLDADGYTTADLKDGMVSNPIVDESIRLYEQEVELALGK